MDNFSYDETIVYLVFKKSKNVNGQSLSKYKYYKETLSWISLRVSIARWHRKRYTRKV